MNARWTTLAFRVAVYSTVFLLINVIHECGHGLMAYLLGASGIVKQDVVYVQGATNAVAIAAAGPLLAGLVGLVALLVLRKTRAGAVADEWLLWTAVVGIVTPIGYGVAAVVRGAGDIDIVATGLGWNDVERIMCSMASIALLLLLSRLFAGDLSRLAVVASADGGLWMVFVWSIAYPLVLATLVIWIAEQATLLEVVHIAATPFILFGSYRFMRRLGTPWTTTYDIQASQVAIAIAALAVGIALDTWLRVVGMPF